MTDPILASYEAVPYHSRPITVTHPGRMAAVAAVFGVTAPAVERCRVLEIGCATGGNLIPMALGLPDGSFVGIDLAPGQIAVGRAVVRALGLRNIRLEAMSLTEVDDAFGTFDYIVCHGVFSWVPAEVQDALLRICARNLAPDGVAYVSYNVLPGWHVRGMVRDMITFHDDATLPAGARMARGLDFVEFLARSTQAARPLYSALLQEELSSLRAGSESYFVHEELEAENRPTYFTHFTRRAAAAGLQYLAESRLTDTAAALPAEVVATLLGWSANIIQLEQYADFVRNRTFRQTLLCHESVAVQRTPSRHALPALHLSARALPAEPAAVGAAGAETFRAPDGVTVTTAHPVVRAALHALADARPHALSFAELAERVRRGPERPAPDEHRAPPAVSDDAPADPLADAMLNCALGGLVDLAAYSPVFASRPGPRPLASPLARLQASEGPSVSNLRHFHVELLDLDRLVLAHADGTRTRDDLGAVVADAVARGAVRRAEGAPATAPSLTRDAIPSLVDASLGRLADAALLVG